MTCFLPSRRKEVLNSRIERVAPETVVGGARLRPDLASRQWPGDCSACAERPAATVGVLNVHERNGSELVRQRPIVVLFVASPNDRTDSIRCVGPQRELDYVSSASINEMPGSRRISLNGGCGIAERTPMRCRRPGSHVCGPTSPPEMPFNGSGNENAGASPLNVVQ